VVAVIYNGIVLPKATAARRMDLVGSIYADLGL